ncbi:hypothetical protein [Streptomyces sp. NPDC006477]|uniref:hypothetical protein n=1 Tax=Streptomyces sp. NPDC006477 TaxID=3364747 RepID=UPI0036A05D79
MMGSVIAILGLLVSVATAIVSYRHGRRAESDQRSRDERDAEARRRQEEQAEQRERIRQASWISSHVAADGRHVVVYNGSSQPVSRLRVLISEAPLGPVGGRTLVPGSATTFEVPPDGAAGGLDEELLAVEFTDVALRTWRRTAEGLRERMSGEGGPPQWGPAVTPLVEPFQGGPTRGGGSATGAGPIPEGPPSGPLGPPPPGPWSAEPYPRESPEPYPSEAPAGGSVRGRQRPLSNPLFVLGCLGALAALTYLLVQLL